MAKAGLWDRREVSVSEPSQGLADGDVNGGAGVQFPPGEGWSGGAGCSWGPSVEATVKG